MAKDLDRWWSAELPKVYGLRYTPLSGWHPATPEALPPACGSRVRYRDIEGNAFYCPLADYVAFDDEQLFPALQERFGDIALAVVLAHEMGHAIQARTRTAMATVYLELQADCFAGAWLRRVVDGRADGVTFRRSDLDEAISASLTFRDSPGTSARNPNAHGNGFDRTTALQTGFDGGLTTCKRFADSPPRVTASSFRTAAEAATGGDIALQDAVDLTRRSITRHFGSLVDPAALDGLDAGELTTAYQRTGDVGASMLIVLAAAAQAEVATRRSSGSSAGSAELRATCLAGTWLGAADRGELSTAEEPLSLSPGDLDEAVIATIDQPSSVAAFDRVRALRTGWAAPGGIRAGIAACSRR